MLDEYINYFFVENLLVSVIVIFVVIYIYLNMDSINSGDYFNGEITKPITYTCIIAIIGLLISEFNNSNNNYNTQTETLLNLPELTREPIRTYKIIDKGDNDDIFIKSRNRGNFGVNM